MNDMDGFDLLGCENPDYVGFDYMKLLSGSGGLLSGLAGGGSGDKGGGSAQDAVKQMQLQQAQQSASNMKMILVGIGAIILAGGVALAVRR